MTFRRRAKGVIWFDFAELCEKPRSQVDYLEIASAYHTVLISGVPQMKPEKTDVVRRFTWLVDVFYDQRVKLVLSAEVQPEELVAPATEVTGPAEDGEQRIRPDREPAAGDAVARLLHPQARLRGQPAGPEDESMKAIYLTKEPAVLRAPRRHRRSELPDDDVLVRVEYSGINYKDGLAITNASPVVRMWPMVAGIDGAGTVEESTHPRFGSPATTSSCTGWGVGETHWGCLAEKARMNGDWLVALPAGMSVRQAMAIGTAGFTAMLCAMALEEFGVRPESGRDPGHRRGGRRGSVAIAILARLGYRVVASTGRPREADFLKVLGATR